MARHNILWTTYSTHELLLAAPRDRHTPCPLTLPKHGILRATQRSLRRLGARHLDVCMAQRLALPIKQDMRTLDGMPDPARDCGRRDVL